MTARMLAQEDRAEDSRAYDEMFVELLMSSQRSKRHYDARHVSVINDSGDVNKLSSEHSIAAAEFDRCSSE